MDTKLLSFEITPGNILAVALICLGGLFGAYKLFEKGEILNALILLVAILSVIVLGTIMINQKNKR